MAENYTREEIRIYIGVLLHVIAEQRDEIDALKKVSLN